LSIGAHFQDEPMKIKLNLATSPLEMHRRFLAGASLLGVAGGIVLVFFGLHVYRTRLTEEDFRNQMAVIQAATAKLRRENADLEQFFARPENAKLHDRAAFINSLIDERSFDWTKMFMDLEKILPPGVRVVSISPKLQKGQVEVKLVIGASGDESKLKFLRALEQSGDFSKIKVLGERSPAKFEGSERVQIELTAWYL
jgi:Tfp pilus assembly protein PilN